MKQQARLSEPAKEFKKIVESADHRHRAYTFFTDWLRLAACALHQEPYHLGLVQASQQPPAEPVA